MTNTCQCGHAKSAHIYEEGACRPGFVCEHSCTKFTAIPVKTSESMANETFEQRLEHESVFGVDEKGPIRFTYEEYDAFKAGANWCREQMQAEIVSTRDVLAHIRLIAAERAKAQKLVAALERISEWGWSEIEGHGRCHNLQGVHADEAIAEYESGKLLK